MIAIAVHGAVVLSVVVLRRRLWVVVVGALVLWILLPHIVVIQTPLSGIHPSSTALVAAGVAEVIMRPARVAETVGARLWIWAPVASFFVLATATKIVAAQPGDLDMLVQQMLAPVSGFLVLSVADAAGELPARHVRLIIVIIATGEAALAWVQSLVQSMIPFDSYYRQFAWYTSTYNRWAGTTDHPLVLGLVIATAMWWTGAIKSVLLRFCTIAVLLLGASATQSRTSLIVCLLGLAAQICFSPMRLPARVVVVLGTAAAAVAGVSAFSTSGVVQRFIVNDGSTTDRSAAYNLFSAHAADYLLSGSGIGGSGAFANDLGSSISLENPFIMYVVDLGLPAALCYFLPQIMLALSSLRRNNIIVGLGGVATVFLVQSFSSIATQSLCATFLWASLALTRPSTRLIPTPADRDHPRLSRAVPGAT